MEQGLNSATCNNGTPAGISSQIMTDKQAAKFLGVGLQTLRNWRCRRQGPDYIKMGRAVRYSVRDLLRYLESRKIRVDGEN